MNTTQKVVTALMGILMLGTILAMPAAKPADRGTVTVRQVGIIGAPVQAGEPRQEK